MNAGSAPGRLDVPGGRIETLTTGSGDPATVFAHGLASSIDETRPFASGVRGTRVFFSFRGHGATEVDSDDWSYDELARELHAVADTYGATRALGISLGAGTLLRAAADDSARFERLVLVLPASIDSPRSDFAVTRMRQMADLVEIGDVAGVETAVLDGEPPHVRDRGAARLWARRRAERLCSTRVGAALREMSALFPLRDRAELRRITAPVLLVSQEGDRAHPDYIARALAAELPDATVAQFDDRGLMWEHGREVRRTIADFLNA